ncbi:MAG: hypothetical protein AAGK80_11910 [Pseudomonadota bacterium]
MTEPLSLREIAMDTLTKTARLVVPSLPFGVLFAIASGVLVWGAGVLPEGGTGFFAFSALTLCALYTHSLFSAAMYRAVLTGQGGLATAAWKLSLAWILVMVVASIAVTIVVLFFSLIGASLGVASGNAGQEITDMTAQMRAGGTFWPLFALFVATLLGLFWFAVRLMLFASASTLRGQVHVFRTWYWTKGHVRTLAPIMVAFIVLPVAALSMLAQAINRAVIGTPESSLELGLSTSLIALILMPSAWLGHAFAASAYERLAPGQSINGDQGSFKR